MILMRGSFRAYIFRISLEWILSAFSETVTTYFRYPGRGVRGVLLAGCLTYVRREIELIYILYVYGSGNALRHYQRGRMEEFPRKWELQCTAYRGILEGG